MVLLEIFVIGFCGLFRQILDPARIIGFDFVGRFEAGFGVVVLCWSAEGLVNYEVVFGEVVEVVGEPGVVGAESGLLGEVIRVDGFFACLNCGDLFGCVGLFQLFDLFFSVGLEGRERDEVRALFAGARWGDEGGFGYLGSARGVEVSSEAGSAES